MAGPVTPLITPKSNAKSGGGGNLVFALALVVAAAGIAFAAGRMTAPAGTTANAAANGRTGIPRGSLAPGATLVPGQFADGGLGGGRGGSVTVDGTVTAVGDGTITIRTANGTETTLATDDTTAYHAQADTSAADVAVGSKVQIRLAGGFGRSAGGPRASGAPGAPANPGASGAPDGQVSARDITILP